MDRVSRDVRVKAGPEESKAKERATQKKAGLGRGLVVDKSSWVCQTLREGTEAAAALISVVVSSWRKMWDLVL